MSTCDLRVVLCSGKRYIGKELGVSEPGKAPPQDASDRWIYSQTKYSQTRNIHRQDIFTDKKYSQTRPSQTRHIHRQDIHRQDIFTEKTPVTGGYLNWQECLSSSLQLSCQWRVDLFTDKNAFYGHFNGQECFSGLLCSRLGISIATLAIWAMIEWWPFWQKEKCNILLTIMWPWTQKIHTLTSSQASKLR